VSKVDQIDHLLEEVVTLPSLPDTVIRVTELVNSPDCSLAEVGKAISADPGLALKTLRLVNSAYYGVRQEVTSIEHAVVLLGEKVIKNLVFTAMVFDKFKVGAGHFLRHCVASGIAMRSLAQAVPLENQPEPDELFIYGLLHDVGRIVFHEFLADEYAQALGVAHEKRLPLYQAEREVLQTDHAEMGGRLAKNWKLPEPMPEAIAHHHDAAACDTLATVELAAMLSIADHMCALSGFPSEPGVCTDVTPEAWQAFGVDSAQIPAILDRFLDNLPAVDELLRLAE